MAQVAPRGSASARYRELKQQPVNASVGLGTFSLTCGGVLQVSQGGAASYDVFTELDPLGTGRSKPYVDKKLFFQELKNPPKKVLKDLVPTQTVMSEVVPVPEDARPDHYGPATTMTSLTRHSGGSVAVARSHQGFNLFQSDPFAETDPFDSADPFSECFKDDPFNIQEFYIPKSSYLIGEEPVSPRDFKPEPPPLENGRSVFNGPLQVSLPPEPAPKSPRLQRQVLDKRCDHLHRSWDHLRRRFETMPRYV